MAFKRLISFVILLFMLAASVSPVALAEVGELDYNNDNLNKTESDGDATVNDGKKDSHWWEEIGNDIGDAFNKGREFLAPLFDTVGDMGDVIAGGWDRFTDWSSDTWNDFSNWSQDTWSSFTDWSANTWDSFTDWSANTWGAFVDGTVNTWNAFTNFTSNVWDATPNWVKSTLSFVGVGAGIVGAVALGVISAPVAIAAGIGAGIAGGAYYLMNRNSDYSFLGSLGWTAGGALLGGIGQATGAIAAAGRGLLSLGKSAWGHLRLAYGAGGVLSTMAEGAIIGGAGSGVISGVKSFITGDFTFGNFMIDIVSGAAIGSLLAPMSVFAGSLLSAGKFGQYASWGLPIATIGGLENFVVEGLKGEWAFVDNFVSGSIAAIAGYGLISHISKWVFSNQRVSDFLRNPASTDVYEEIFNKGTEDIIKDNVKNNMSDSEKPNLNDRLQDHNQNNGKIDNSDKARDLNKMRDIHNSKTYNMKTSNMKN